MAARDEVGRETWTAGAQEIRNDNTKRSRDVDFIEQHLKCGTSRLILMRHRCMLERKLQSRQRSQSSMKLPETDEKLLAVQSA